MGPHSRPAELAVKVGTLCLFGVIAMALVGSSMRIDREYREIAPKDLPGRVVVVIRESCPSCRALRPQLEQLIAEGYPLKIVDLDQPPDARIDPPVERVPCFLLIHDGNEIRRRDGDLPESELRRLWLPAYRLEREGL